MFVFKYFSLVVMCVLASSQPAIDYGAIGNRPFINLPETPCYRPRNFLKPVLCFDQTLPESIDLCPCPSPTTKKAPTTTTTTAPTTTTPSTTTTTTTQTATPTAQTTTTTAPTTTTMAQKMMPAPIHAPTIPWGMLFI